MTSLDRPAPLVTAARTFGIATRSAPPDVLEVSVTAPVAGSMIIVVRELRGCVLPPRAGPRLIPGADSEAFGLPSQGGRVTRSPPSSDRGPSWPDG